MELGCVHQKKMQKRLVNLFVGGFFWPTCVNKVSLCNDPPVSVRLSVWLSVCLSVINFNIGNISDTIHSRVMKVGQRVACGETFKMM